MSSQIGVFELLCPSMPGIWTVACAVVLGTAVTGALVPALRASRVDPVQVLRLE